MEFLIPASPSPPVQQYGDEFQHPRLRRWHCRPWCRHSPPKKGHDVTVIESAAELIDVGACIEIPHNSSRILISWGLEIIFLEKVVLPGRIQMRRYANGAILGLQDVNDGNTQKYSLSENIYDAAKEAGAKFMLGHRVESVDENGPAIILRDGQRLHANLIVGADSIRSKIRHLILKDKDPGEADSPNCAYRATVAAEIMNRDPELASIMSDPQGNLWMGPGGHVMGYPIKNSTIYNVVMSQPRKAAVGKWNAPGDVNEIRKIHENWDPILIKVLSHVDHCLKWKLAYVPPLDP